jgi:hypothetical protein
MPSVLKSNLKFLASFANFRNSLLIACHFHSGIFIGCTIQQVSDALLSPSDKCHTIPHTLLIALHWDPSAGCLNISSTLQSSLCHRSNFACSLFLNKHFKRGIIDTTSPRQGFSSRDVHRCPQHHQGHLT